MGVEHRKVGNSEWVPARGGGFTLIETIFALAVLVILALNTVATLGKCIGVDTANRERDVARLAARARLEQVLAWPDYASLEPTFDGNTFTANLLTGVSEDGVVFDHVAELASLIAYLYSVVGQYPHADNVASKLQQAQDKLGEVPPNTSSAASKLESAEGKLVEMAAEGEMPPGMAQGHIGTIDQIGVGYGLWEPSDTDFADGTVFIDDTNPELVRITVRLEWTGSYGPDALELSTLLANPESGTP